jgi:hypothetical protein
VTKAPEKGAVLGENAVAMEVDGRPVRTLQGAIPMYRDIRPGDQGDDVRQLEHALERLGFHPGKLDGVYDVATEGAVEAWYRAAGYTAPGITDEQRDRLRAAHAAVSTAEAAVLQGAEALAKVRKGISAKDVHQAEADVRARARDAVKARDDLKVAQAAEALARSAEAASGLAEIAARTAELKIAAENRLALARAASDVVAARHRLSEAQAAKRVADQRYVDDQTTYTPDNPATPANESHRVASDGQLEQDRADVERAANGVLEANDTWANAQLASDVATASTGQATRQGALDTERAVQARRQAELSTLQTAQATIQAGRAIDAANDGADLAGQNLAFVREPPEEASAVASLRKAQRDLSDARADEQDLAGTTGVVVPADEAVFFPTLPLRVDEAKVGRGDDGTKEVMVVTTSRLAIDASVSVPDARLVKVGDEVEVRGTELGVTAKGTVSKLADKPGTNGVDAQRVYLEAIPRDAPDQLTGASVAVSIAVKASKGKVLAVPVAAVTVDASGNARVVVVGRDGTRRTVGVTTGLSAEGYVEIRSSKRTVAPGDRVLVGSHG